MANYLVIQKNDESAAYAFKVNLEGWRPEIEKIQREQYTITGTLDVQNGPTRKGWAYAFRLFNEVTGSFSVSAGSIMTATSVTWGDLDTLKTLFEESTPPNNKYRFRDLDGQESYMFFWGRLSLKSLTPIIIGGEAYIEVQVLMKGSAT